MYFFRVRRRRKSSVTRHYLEHKEQARELVLSRLNFFNHYYDYKWNRIAIRNPKSCWGSCTSLKNLNFSYKILFLPPHLQDYIIVHELCHLKELNHGKKFWMLLEEAMPQYKQHVQELRMIEQGGSSIQYLTKVRDYYLSRAIKKKMPKSDVVTNYQPYPVSCACNGVCNCRIDKVPA